MACSNTCHETGHLIVEELTYTPKKCSVCNKRCLFRTRKMIRCIACKCVTHKRCWAAANRLVQVVKVLTAPAEELHNDMAMEEMAVPGGERPEASQVVVSEIRPEPKHVVSGGEEVMSPRVAWSNLVNVVDDVESKEKDLSVDDKFSTSVAISHVESGDANIENSESPTSVAISHVESGDANIENGDSPTIVVISNVVFGDANIGNGESSDSVAISRIESGDKTVSEDDFMQATEAIRHVLSSVETLLGLSSPSNDSTEAVKVLVAPEEELRDDVTMEEIVVPGGERPEESQVSEIKPEPMHVVSGGEEAMSSRVTWSNLVDEVDDNESKEKDSSVDDKSPTSMAISHVESGDANNENGESPARVAISCIESGDKTISEDGFAQTTVAISHVVSSVEAPQGLSSPSNDNTEESTLINVNPCWRLRYSLFSVFDDGIMLDEDSLCSTCPEVLARYMAKRCSFQTVMDPFCGAGGNAIRLALTCANVFAMDVDPKKVALARKNAEIYGVADRIVFMVGDFFERAKDFMMDAVVTSPPWGGPGYQMQSVFDSRDLCGRGSGGMAAILRTARGVAPKVVIRVPTNVDQYQCVDMAMAEGFCRLLFESVVIDGIQNCKNLYFTRNDFRVGRPPVRTWREVQLSTSPLSIRQQDNLVSQDKMYATYLENVSRFLEE